MELASDVGWAPVVMFIFVIYAIKVLTFILRSVFKCVFFLTCIGFRRSENVCKNEVFCECLEW